MSGGGKKKQKKDEKNIGENSKRRKQYYVFGFVGIWIFDLQLADFMHTTDTDIMLFKVMQVFICAAESTSEF